MGQFKKIELKKFKDSIFTMEGISKTTVENHLKLYEGYVKKVNEITEKLKMVDGGLANQVYSEIRELKVELSFAIGGVKNHELYFDHLGGSGGKPMGSVAEIIDETFGSYDNWVIDLKATAMAARGWAWLAYDRDWKVWCNYIGDSQNTYPIWNATPVIALDTYEHAYWADYGTNRAAYIDAFLHNLDWEAVEKQVALIAD